MIRIQFGMLCVMRNVTAKMTSMVCAACVLGVGIGIGGIFLYRVLRQWLRQTSEHPSLNQTVEQMCSGGSLEKHEGTHCTSETMV